MTTMIWLRAETKDMEARSALTPMMARKLVDAGIEVMVERCGQRAISDAAFAATGCALVEPGNWQDAPAHAWILGLKELPPGTGPLVHRHIYFAHAYKNQQGWQALLGRFREGGGELYDLEYLLDENGRRVAAFGYWAGFAGCAVALLIWSGQQLGYAPVMPALEPYANKDELIAILRQQVSDAMDACGHHPTIIVIGAKGRVGEGAIQVAHTLGLTVTPWDMAETAAGGPFPAILEHDVFINCVLVQKKIAPFINAEILQQAKRKLSVICDVSCDPGEYNPVPLYDRPTTFSAPVIKVIDGEQPLYLSAIDHLPSLLPVEASEDFGNQLLPHLLGLKEGLSPVWQGALQYFHNKSAELS